MRDPVLRLDLDANELVIDNFAGGGGASTGIFAALGRAPDIAVNHDPNALAVYKANHPETRILCEDVFDVQPRFVCGGRAVGFAWFSPDCTFFSRARGARPFRDRLRARRRRGLAGVVLKWAEQVHPRVIAVENVPEFREWGPLGDDGLPDPTRKGKNFLRWRARLINLGYQVETRILRACDFGAPTSRQRLFILARCDGLPISWPAPSHGPKTETPYRTAAECIDWSLPCPSIFDRKKPLAAATLRRIARGIQRYVLEAAQPFVVPLTHQGDDRTYSLDEPFRTITSANRGEQALVEPIVVPLGATAPVIARLGQTGGTGKYCNGVAEPLTTVTTKAEHLLASATLVQTGYGERPGQAPRVPGLHKPLGTVVADGQKHALVNATLAKPNLVSAFLAKGYGGPSVLKKQSPGTAMTSPIDTITSKDHHGLIAPTLVKFKGSCKDGQPVTEPLATVQAQGLHYAEVRAFLVKYYGTAGDGQPLTEPTDTVTTKARFGLVTVAGVDYQIVDIGMRMLSPRELYLAQGFPITYVIDPYIDVERISRSGKIKIVRRRLTKTEQVHKCGNSVPPPFSFAIARALFADGLSERQVA